MEKYIPACLSFHPHPKSENYIEMFFRVGLIMKGILVDTKVLEHGN